MNPLHRSSKILTFLVFLYLHYQERQRKESFLEDFCGFQLDLSPFDAVTTEIKDINDINEVTPATGDRDRFEISNN